MSSFYDTCSSVAIGVKRVNGELHREMFARKLASKIIEKVNLFLFVGYLGKPEKL
jgi:hypothetical protein